MRLFLSILFFTHQIWAQSEVPSLDSFIEKACKENPGLCQPNPSQINLFQNLNLQCENLKNQFGCNDLTTKNPKLESEVYSCKPGKMCQRKTPAFQCLIGAGEALTDLLIGLITLPYSASQFITKAFENDKACYENKNNLKENLTELYDLSIPDIHSDHKLNPQIKSAMKNWPCSEIRNYLYQKNKSYQSFLGPLVAKGHFKPENHPSALSMLLAELKKEIGLRWECYTPAAKAEIACYSLTLLFPSLALKIPAQTITRMTEFDLTNILSKLKAKQGYKPADPKLNPQIALWEMKESKKVDSARALEKEIQNTLQNGQIVSASTASQGVMKAQILTFENGMMGLWKPSMIERGKQYDLKEVAAYKVDEHLGFNQVPYTTNRQYQGKDGSIQLLVKKLDDTEFGKDPQHFRMFDYLLANRDRHGGNILSVDGRPIAIDHGFSFVSPTVDFPKKISSVTDYFPFAKTKIEQENLRLEVKSLLPKKEVYEKLAQTSETEWRSLLKPYLTEMEQRSFIYRRREIIKSVERAQKEMGPDIFPDGQYSPLMRYDPKTKTLPEQQYTPAPKFGDPD